MTDSCGVPLAYHQHKCKCYWKKVSNRSFRCPIVAMITDLRLPPVPGSAHEYVVNTFDPIIAETHLRDDNYFYYLCLMLKYNPRGLPAYLSEEGFHTLKCNPSRLDAIKIHTDMIINVLYNQVADGELTKVILMDHLDWFSPEDADAEISAVAKKMKNGGKAFWRSAGKRPWYNEILEQRGFKVWPCQIREGDTMCIDRVNMYASFWCGEKL